MRNPTLASFPRRRESSKNNSPQATHRMRQANDQNTPYLPYYHLRTSGFWHHKIRAGREHEYNRLQESNSRHKTISAIEYAYVDPELLTSS